MKKKCDVCNKRLTGLILSLGKQPLCDDIRKSLKDKISLYKIELKLCKNCLTINQLHSVDQKKLFPKDYKYRSGLTEDVKNGLKDLVLNADQFLLKKNVLRVTQDQIVNYFC